MRPIEEEREATLPEVIIQLRSPSESEVSCSCWNPGILEAVYGKVRIPCCEKCKTRVTAEARGMTQKARLDAEFELAKQQRETQ